MEGKGLNTIKLINVNMKVEYWYDRHTKSWVIQNLDFEGNQIGKAYYVYSKREASDLAKFIQLES